MANNVKTDYEKRLKRNKFSVLDSAFACLWFIALQFIFVSVFSALPKSISGNSFVLVIAQILIEGVFLLASYVTAKIRDVEWVKATTIQNKIDGKSIIFALALAVVTMVCFAPLTDLFMYGIQALGYKYSASSIDVSNFGLYLVSLVVHCAVPAITEELLFRGTICSGLESKNKHLAVIVSAFIFMLMHGWPVQTMHQIILGIVFGYLFISTHNIWLSILVHFFNNAIAVTMLYVQTLLYPELVMMQDELITFTAVDTMTLLFNIGYAIVMATIGVVLSVILIKTITRFTNNKNSQKTKESDTLKVDGQQEETSVELQDNNKDQVMEEKPVLLTKREKIWAIVCFSIAGVSLVFDWVMALITGFLL